MSEKEICSICYDTYETDKIKIVLGCNHTFHFNCLKKWKNEDKDSCPLCRGKMNIELTTQKEKKEEEDEETEEENKEEGNINNSSNQQNNILNAFSRSIFGSGIPTRRRPTRRRTRRVRTRGGVGLISSILPF